jgi:hypothetical protein
MQVAVGCGTANVVAEDACHQVEELAPEHAQELGSADFISADLVEEQHAAVGLLIVRLADTAPVNAPRRDRTAPTRGVDPAAPRS